MDNQQHALDCFSIPPKFTPSIIVQCHQLNIMILKEKDELIKQDLINQYNELINIQCETEKSVFDFQFKLY